MSERVSKNTTTKKIQQSKSNGGYKTEWGKRELTCACCNNKFIRYGDEILYKFNGKVFCSWNCKRKYERQVEKRAEEKLRNEWKRKAN